MAADGPATGMAASTKTPGGLTILVLETIGTPGFANHSGIRALDPVMEERRWTSHAHAAP